MALSSAHLEDMQAGRVQMCDTCYDSINGIPDKGLYYHFEAVVEHL